MSQVASHHHFGSYAKQLRRVLPAEVFRPAPGRLVWLPINLAIIATAVAAILLADLIWGWRLLAALVIGHTFAVNQFLGHEILHGAIVKNRRWQNLLGGICMLHHCIGPAQWRSWHNRFHHGRTNRSGHDPDSFADVALARAHPFTRELAKFSPGSGYWRSWLFPVFWFTFQAAFVLWFHSQHMNYWTPKRRRRQLALFGAMVGFWAAIGAAVGASNFLFLYVVPLAVANFVQLSYIVTNHLMCEQAAENDPLANSLSVQVPRLFNFLHLGVAFHVEHHVFPSISGRHAPLVREALKERYGSRYRQMPLWRALLATYRTPSVHLGPQELVSMRTGEVYSTLGACGELPERVDRVAVPVRPRRRGRKTAPGFAHQIRIAETTRTPLAAENDISTASNLQESETDTVESRSTIDNPQATPGRRRAA